MQASTKLLFAVFLLLGSYLSAAQRVAVLSAVSFDSGTLVPSFRSDWTHYYLNIANSATLKLTATFGSSTTATYTNPASPNNLAVRDVDAATGTSLTSGTAVTLSNLAVGLNWVYITTSQTVNGVANTYPSFTDGLVYVVTINRAAASENSDSSATLAWGTTAGGTMSPTTFSASTYSYTVTGSTVAAPTVTVTPVGAGALFQTRNTNTNGEDSDWQSTTGTVTLATTAFVNRFYVRVRAASGAYSIYTITIYRSNIGNYVTTMTFTNSITIGTFAQTTFKYSASVANTVYSTTITADGSNGAYVDFDGPVSGATNSASGEGMFVYLRPGVTVVRIPTAASNSLVRWYTVYITRATAASGTNTALSALSVANGGTTYPLNHAFDARVRQYTAYIYGTVPGTLDITATAADSNAFVTVVTGESAVTTSNNIENLGSPVYYSSSTTATALTNNKVTLTVGANKVYYAIIRVSAADGSAVRTYHLRILPSVSGQVAFINSVTVTSVTSITPAFHPRVYSYFVVVPNTVSTATLTATANTLLGSGTAATFKVADDTACTQTGGVYSLTLTNAAQIYTCSMSLDTKVNGANGVPTYRFSVWRAGTTNTAVAELSSAAFTYTLTAGSVVTSLTLSPTFATTTYYYTSSFDFSLASNNGQVAWTFTLPTGLTVGNNVLTRVFNTQGDRDSLTAANPWTAGLLTGNTGSVSDSLNYGITLQVRVISNEGAIIRDYVFYFTNSYIFRPKPALLSLVPSVGLLSPTFSPLTRSYTLILPYDVERWAFTARTAGLQASTTDNTGIRACGAADGNSMKDFGSYWASLPQAVTRDSYAAVSCPINLYNSQTSSQYTLSIVRLKSGYTSLNSDARLSALEFTGTLASTVTLSPTFSSDVYSYSFTNSYASGSRYVRLAVKPVDPAASVSISAHNAYNQYDLKTGNTAANVETEVIYTTTGFELNANWNVIVITVQSADSNSELSNNVRRYYVYITDSTAQLFNEARLSTLSITTATWTPMFFAPDYYHYNVTTANDKVTVNAAPVNANSALKYKLGWSSVWTPLAASTNTDLSIGYGLTWLYILSTAPTQRGDVNPAARLYTIQLWRTGATGTNSNNYLSALAPLFNAPALTPAFTPTRQGYTYTVDPVVGSVIFTATAAGAGATILVGSDASDSWTYMRGDVTPRIALKDGRNLVVLRVVASDLSAPRDYHIFITRSTGSNYASKQVLFTGLEVTGTLSPSFSASTFQYTVTTDQASVSITPRAVIGSVDVNAIVRVTGSRTAHNQDIATGSTASVALATGYNQITLTIVSAFYGGSYSDNTYLRRTYVLHYFRTNSKGYTNTLLNALSYSTDTGITHALTPRFSPAQTRYWSVADAQAAKVSFTVTSSDSGATVSVAPAGGSSVTIYPASTTTTVNLNSFTLNTGANIFLVNVLGSDKSTSKSYTVYIAKPSVNSTNINTLAYLSTSGPYGFVPSFSPGTVRYTETVDASFGSFSFQAFASDPWASVRVAKLGAKDYTHASLEAHTGHFDSDDLTNQATTYSVADDGLAVADSTFTLNYGPNFFRITVRARDQSYRFYVVNVVRQIPDASPFLQAVAFSQGTLTPDFRPETTVYTLNLPSNPMSVLYVQPLAVGGSRAKLNFTTATLPTWAASSANASAATTSHGAYLTFNLVAGLQQISIYVTSVDGLASVQYSFVVFYPSSATDASTNLASLSFGTGNALSESRSSFLPAFSADVSDYYLNINNWNGDNQLIRLYIAPEKDTSTVWYTSGFLNNLYYDSLNANTYQFGSLRTVGNAKSSVTGAVVYDPTEFFLIPFGTSVFNFYVTSATGVTRRYSVTIRRADSPVSITLIGDYTGTGLTYAQQAVLQGAILGYFDLFPTRLQSFSTSAYYGTLPSAPNTNGTLRAAPLSGLSVGFKILASPDDSSLAQSVGQAAASTTNNPFLDPNSILYQAFKQNGITLLSSSANTDTCLANPALCGSASVSSPLISLTILLAFALSLLLL